MQQSLAIGLTALPLGWKRIVKQEGLEFSLCNFTSRVSPGSFAAVIVNSQLNEKQAENANQFLRSGGAILTTYCFVSALDREIRFAEKEVKFIEAKGKFFSGAGLMWLNQKAAMFDGQTHVAPLAKRIGKGFLLVLPFDPDKATISPDFEERGFVAGKATVAVFAPSASKSNIRVVTVNCLRHLFQLRQLPFIQLWYYPQGFRSVFCFHIDVDNFTSDVLSTANLFRQLDFNSTWFMNMEAVANAESNKIITVLRNEPCVGQHAFVHSSIADSNETFKDVLKGDREIRRLGFKPSCFSAPNGVWNAGTAKAVKKLGYDFAIAFSLDNDNLPFNPIIEGKEANTLFLPTHPVCIGVLKTYDFNERDMIEYFKMVIDRNVKAGLPILFYGHPLKRIARFPNVIKIIVQEIRARGNIWEASHKEFVKWWRSRQNISFKAAVGNGYLRISAATDSKAAFRATFNSKQLFLPVRSRSLNIERLEEGEAIFSGTLQDTAPKPSSLGKKYLAKKMISEGLQRFIGKKLR